MILSMQEEKAKQTDYLQKKKNHTEPRLPLCESKCPNNNRKEFLQNFNRTSGALKTTCQANM